MNNGGKIIKFILKIININLNNIKIYIGKKIEKDWFKKQKNIIRKTKKFLIKKINNIKKNIKKNYNNGINNIMKKIKKKLIKK